MADKVDFRYHETDKAYVKQINRVYKVFSKYHKHKVFGIEHIPKEGRALIAVNHSLATYDIGMLQYQIYKHCGRFPRGFADNAFFKIPLIGRIAGKSGAVPGRHHVGEFLLKEKEELVLVAPGGMREALRPKQEKYKVKWEKRKGFVKLALKTQTPIILAACPHADDLYEVNESKLTKLVYKNLKLPLPMIEGGRRAVKPKKVKLTHYIRPPLMPPKVDVQNEAAFNNALDQWHNLVVQEMNLLMNNISEDV